MDMSNLEEEKKDNNQSYKSNGVFSINNINKEL